MEVKEAPARGLRAVFAGFGRALGGRRKGGAAPAAQAEATGGEGHVKVVDTEAAAETTTAEAAAAQPVAAETVAAQTVPDVADTMPDVVPETATTQAAQTTETAAGGELPLANYDTLTVASLRARLRTLTVPQLRILVDYEQAHQGREEVTGMFERRIAKIVAGETTGFPVVK
jgi:hypothetical protein